MKTIRISKTEGKEGLAFDTVENVVAYEMELRGKVIFLMKEGSSEDISLDKAEGDPKKDFGQILPALSGAAFRILEETDYEVVRISKLQATLAEELEEAIVGSGVEVIVNPDILDKLKKEQ